MTQRGETGPATNGTRSNGQLTTDTPTIVPPRLRVVRFLDVERHVERLAWDPEDGSVADVLMRRHADGHCEGHARSLVNRFARIALRAEGYWWLDVLSEHVEDVSDADRAAVMAYWRAWLAGERPFRYRRAG